MFDDDREVYASVGRYDAAPLMVSRLSWALRSERAITHHGAWRLLYMLTEHSDQSGLVIRDDTDIAARCFMDTADYLEAIRYLEDHGHVERAVNSDGRMLCRILSPGAAAMERVMVRGGVDFDSLPDSWKRRVPYPGDTAQISPTQQNLFGEVTR